MKATLNRCVFIGKRGYGIRIEYKSGLDVTTSKYEIKEKYTYSFENINFTINVGKVTVTFSIKYRPIRSIQMALITYYSLVNGLNT